jgi:hypothetical protein
MPSLHHPSRISTNPEKLRRSRQAHRGVILLIVASLLTLLLLIGVTFVLLASRSLDRAKIEARRDEVGDQPEKEFDLVLGQLLYDTAARSSLNGHSLLEDLYGRDLLAGTLTSAGTSQWGGQAISFTASTAPPGHSPVFDYYTGRVLTFIDGPLAGQSTRILQFDPTIPQFVVEAQTSAAAPQFGNRFLVNGAPFNGTGAGYDAKLRLINAEYVATVNMGNDVPGLVSLLPHFNGYDIDGGGGYFGYLGVGFYDPIHDGGLDESWDAVDMQNMYLAMVPPNTAELRNAGSAAPLIPSFHRPELANYWRNNLPSELTASSPNLNPFTNPSHANFLRTFLFRPMPWDHRNFSGGNINLDYAAIRQQVTTADPSLIEPAISEQVTAILLNNLSNLNGIWDVDNDGDGVPDSVWVDPGLPVVTAADGKRYKRLVAILVKDMDGRADLNGHGNLAQIDNSSGGYVNRAETPLLVQFGLAPAGTFLPRGLGFGPAEVDMTNLYGGNVAEYSNILYGKYSSNLSGPGPIADTGGNSRPGIPAGTPPTFRDALDIVKHHGIPNNYPVLGMWYSSPPDVFGRGAVSLDHGGQPIYALSGVVNEMYDNPYELALNGLTNNADSPYTMVELERMLRYHDLDAQKIVSRPLALAPLSLASNNPGIIGNDHTNRERLGLGSSHLPVASAYSGGAPGGRAGGSTNRPETSSSETILDLYYRRLERSGLIEPQLSQEFAKLVPWEFRRGGKFDINRWFGDGFDNNLDGGVAVASTIDDPGEALAGETAWQGGPSGFGGATAHHSNGVDVNLDGAVDGVDRYLAKQLYARHLFCLAMLIYDPDTNADFDGVPPHEPLSAAQAKLLLVRRIAQWAINVVDARDPDGIMTAFEYDANPWNGWQVDSNPNTNADREVPDPTDPTRPVGDLVWGTECPELLITETLAFHARHVKDTSNAGPNDDKRSDTNPNDQTLDQFRIPQGSLFIELYCPRPFNWLGNASQKPRLPAELYDLTNPLNPQLNLGQVRPTAGGWPTWRIAISPLTWGDAQLEQRRPNQMVQIGQQPESASFEPAPANANLLPLAPPVPGAMPVERYVWFCPPNPSVAGTFGANSFFLNTAGQNLLGGTPFVQPGQYAIVGPRATTYLGSQDPTNTTGTAQGDWGDYARQQVALVAGGISVTDLTTAAAIPIPSVRPAVPVIVDSEGIPNGWMNPRTIGLNISEPLPASGGYYPEPVLAMAPPMGVPPDVYDDPTAPAQTYLDDPLDDQMGYPLGDRSMAATGTYPDCASLYLQRLANPNLPYNPLPPDPNHNPAIPINPYLSVDWSATDLTVFPGDEPIHDNPAPDGNVFDPADDPMARPNGGTLKWASRQRGSTATPSDTPNLWNPWTADPPDNDVPVALAPEFFPYELNGTRQTLAYLNVTLGTPQGAPYTGEPTSPFAWLTHLNRPFTNPHELLLVSSSSPARLCSEFTPGLLSNSFPAMSPYDGTNPNAFRAPFGHLLNFFHGDEFGDSRDSPHFHQILDYVEVPSPFMGTERWYNPATFGALPPNTQLYNPPFNKMSRFRDPGRININTVFDEQIFYAGVSQFPSLYGPAFWDKLTRSRKGAGGSWLAADPNLPTLFANPFRATGTSRLIPNVAGVRRRNPVDAGFLRPDPDTAPGSYQPLFDQAATQPTDAYRNTARNAYFRYQALQKIGNIFSTHSNVFAVWMTVGYFEVESAPTGVSAAHPDGLALGQEVGADSGEITRHRAFYIIDRSIPVGFAPGQKLNSDGCVILRRMIE